MTPPSAHRDVDGRRIPVSNLDKVLFPTTGVTKGELIDHYQRCAAPLLSAVGGRPLTLRRWPDGIDREGWFQKHAPGHLPDWVSVAAVPRSDRGDSIDHIVADSPATLVYLANLAAVELHVGPSLAATPDRPDEFVIDLDPPPGADVALVRRATHRCHRLLDELGMASRIKTSGSVGFHVHVPLRGQVSQALARDVARIVATVLAGRYREEMTVEHRIERRDGRVFVDWLRNSPRQTFVAPYSVRAREGAPVATPIAWDELDGTDPQRWSIRTLPGRLAHEGDAWKGEQQRTDLHVVAPALSAALREVA